MTEHHQGLWGDFECIFLEVVLVLSHKGVAISYFHYNPCDVTVVAKPGVVFFSLLSNFVVPVPEN